MKKLVILFLFLAVNTKVFAENGSTSVQSSVTSISNSGGSTHTNIKVEDNGNLTTYSSDQGGSVNVNSVNGQSTITVNGQEVTPTISLEKPSLTPTPSVIENKNKRNSMELKDRILEQARKPFKVLWMIFFSWFH